MNDDLRQEILDWAHDYQLAIHRRTGLEIRAKRLLRRAIDE